MLAADWHRAVASVNRDALRFGAIIVDGRRLQCRRIFSGLSLAALLVASALGDPVVFTPIPGTGSYPTRIWQNGFDLGTVPAGQYQTFFIATDWTASGGAQWSTEARVSLHGEPLGNNPGNLSTGPLDSGTIYVATQGSASGSGAGTGSRLNMYWLGDLSKPIESDGSSKLYLSTRQIYASANPGDNTATWGNIRVILDPEVQKTVATVEARNPLSVTELGTLAVGGTNLTLPVVNEDSGFSGISWYRFGVDSTVESSVAFDIYTTVGRTEVDTRLSLFREVPGGLTPVASTDDMDNLVQAGLTFGSADVTQFQRPAYTGTIGSWFNGRGGNLTLKTFSQADGYYAQLPGQGVLVPDASYLLAVSQFSGARIEVQVEESLAIESGGVLKINTAREVGYSLPSTPMGNADVLLTIRSDAATPSLVWYGDSAQPGGGGTWTVDGLNWWNGTTLQAWDPGLRAVFPGGGGEVVVQSGIRANGGIRFADTTYALSGSLLVLGNPIGPASVLDVPAGASASLILAVDAAPGITKTGTGQLILGGPLVQSSPITIAGGELRVTSNEILTEFTGIVGIDAASAFVIDAAAAGMIQARLQGSGVLAPRGSGAVQIRHANPDFRGSVLIQGGNLEVGDSLAIGTTAAVVVAAGGTLRLPEDRRIVTTVSSLSVNEQSLGGLVDLGAGEIDILAFGVTATALREAIKTGRANGGWSGSSGIASSLAASSAGTRAVGYVLEADGRARVSYAASGDVDLNGQVDVFDLVGIGGAGTYGVGKASIWGSGDFNYDGVTNVFDIVSINTAGAFAKGNYYPTASLPEGIAVPEPASTIKLLICLLGLLRLHGRRRAITKSRVP